MLSRASRPSGWPQGQQGWACQLDVPLLLLLAPPLLLLLPHAQHWVSLRQLRAPWHQQPGHLQGTTAAHEASQSVRQGHMAFPVVAYVQEVVHTTTLPHARLRILP